MEKTGWKITAIVFMSLFLILLVAVTLLWNLGANMIAQENECAVNICGEQYDSYSYDDYEEICYCFTDGEVAYQKFLG